MRLQAVEPRRLYRQIADQIRTLIGKGEVQPGARLPAERDLARQLGVSRPSQTAQSTAAIQALLAPFGVTGARFFLNGVDTSTSGVDVVARYRTQQDFGRFDFTLAGNFNSTEVISII